MQKMVKKKAKRRFKIGHTFNLIILRFLLSFLVFFSILLDELRVAIPLFVLTAFVAFLDGFIAKKHKIKSQLRGILDPVADKFRCYSAIFWRYFASLGNASIFSEGRSCYGWCTCCFIKKCKNYL